MAMVPTVAVTALEQVDYIPSHNFTFNVSSGNPNQDFGTVHIESDSTNGWRLEVRSRHHGTMKRSGSHHSIPYVLEVNGITINDLDSGNNEIVYEASNLTCAPPRGCDWEVRATILPNDLDGNAAGNYSDSLTFTLTNR
ncbi:MAG: hypothetical protein AB4042_21960 [Leptolyngbyaceae cyanobacterium]